MNSKLECIENKISQSLQRSSRKRSSVELLPVTKGQSVEVIRALYDLGFRCFGENRVQEALPKTERLPKEISWHFIGSLQRNKVGAALSVFSCVQSVDRLELAKKLSETASELKKNLPIFLEVNASQEASKHGFSFEEIQDAYLAIQNFPYLQVRGLMTLGPSQASEQEIRGCFARLKACQFKLQRYAKHASEMQELSMGMSDDYEIAIEEGSTLIRLGRALFKDLV